MVPLAVVELNETVGGELIQTGRKGTVASIATDSRSLRPGDLFVPLKGGKFDGHDFIEDAAAAGAAGFLTAKWNKEMAALAGSRPELTVIKVGDTLTALQQLAAAYRRRLSVVVVAITGSTGKTGTKYFLENIVKQRLPVVAAPKNYNNEIGVPLTLLTATPAAKVIIVEMGMRGLGQIACLAELARPNIGLVTNIGQAHIGVVGSQARIAAAKSELLRALPPDGVAVLNADDVHTPSLARTTKAKVVTFGLKPSADVYAGVVYLDDQARACFEITVPGEKFTVKLALPGRHQVYNALAAAAAALALGVDAAAVRDGLAAAAVLDRRLQVKRSTQGVVIINDAYNSNPDSVRAALATAAAYGGVKRRAAVLGDMAELGPHSAEAHLGVGAAAARADLDLLVTIGREAEKISSGALAAGMDNKKVKHFSGRPAALAFLRHWLKADDLVLLKASRFMELEKLAESLEKQE